MARYYAPTMIITTENGPVTINASDYDPSIHTLFGVETHIVDEPMVVAINPGIVKDGDKWYVVDMNRDNERIADTHGYSTKTKATEAAQSLIA